MTNIFSKEMSIFIKLFQFFALYPSSVLLKFYSVINFIATITIFISAFFICNVLQEDNSLSILVGGLVFVGILLTHLMNILQAFTSRNEQEEIHRKFDQIDMLLSSDLFININYADVRNRLLKKYSLISLILLSIHVVSITSVAINGLFFSYYIHLIFPVIVIRFRCIQNMFYIDLIKEKLQLLNQKLERDVIPQNHDKIFLIVKSFSKRDTKSMNTYDTIMVMKTVYGKIWDITNLCNDCFGYSLLFIVSVTHIIFVEFILSLLFLR